MLSNTFGRSPWKWGIVILGIVIVLASVIYANYLAERLTVIEANYSRIFARAQEDLNQISEEGEECNCCDMSLHLRIIESNMTIPTLIVDDMDNSIIDAYNFADTTLQSDSTYLAAVLQDWIDEGRSPILSAYQTSLWMGESRMLNQLRIFPYVQFLLIACFISFGYYALNAARKAEQNRVWVGLAKETAHQLGTPISAMVGWTEHLRMMYEDQPDILEIADELEKDVDRLSMVATRFSKIGASPELVEKNIFVEVAKVVDYMEKRAPRKVRFEFPDADTGDLHVMVNSSLFDWVVENLLRNALDALEGEGLLYGEIIEETNRVVINIKDTGKGIPSNKFNAVFKPGYTTKTRGWGLGLSLAKRIVEDYHNGKIFVKESEIGKGTTFCIILPKV